MTTTPILEVEGLSKKYKDNRILNDISFKVFPGETLSIIGPSGAGKSTLLRAINWLEPADSGRTYLRGKEYGLKNSADGARILMSDKELSPYRMRITMVFQHFAIWPHLTVMGNIIEAPMKLLKMDRTTAIEYARALLDRVGLREKEDEYPSRLSGGQKQRVGIARALAMRPDVILFDEPTSALDAEVSYEVIEVISELANNGLTMIMVTHELDLAKRISNNILFLDCGKIAAEGTPEEIFIAPKSNRLKEFIKSR